MTGQADVAERQPLLAKQDDHSVPCKDGGLPWTPMLVLCIWRSSHAVYFGYILTWITRFLLHNNLADENTVGNVAGWIESAYSLGVLAGLAPASILADAWGRKPTSMCGILFASVGTMLFGFAKTVPQLVALRFVNGFFVAFLPATVLASMIELATPATMPMVFTLNSVAWRFGILVAPFMGGFLAEPATYYPGLFGGTIWERYPYALSGVAASSLPLAAVVLGVFVIPETLPRHQRRSLLATILRRKQGSTTAERSELPEKAPLRGLFTKPVCFMLVLWGYYVFQQMTSVVAEVLFLSSPTSVGGLDFGPRDMAILYAVRPIMSSIINILVYPSLARRYTTVSIFRWGVTLNNTTFYGSYFVFGLYTATHNLSHGLKMFILFVLSIPLGINGSTSTACTQALSLRAPSKAYLARILTAQEYVANTGHGLGSLAGSNAWALGVTYSVLHGQAVWLFLLVIAIILAVLASRLTHQKSWHDEEDEGTAVEVEGEA